MRSRPTVGTRLAVAFGFPFPTSTVSTCSRVESLTPRSTPVSGVWASAPAPIDYIGEHEFMRPFRNLCG